MDTKTIADAVLLRKARMFEIGEQIKALQFEEKAIKDELLLFIGKAQAYAEAEVELKKALEDMVSKVRAELEAERKEVLERTKPQ